MKKTVVIIDDSPTIRKSVKIILEGADYSVMECEDGKEALVVLQGLAEAGDLPSMIITDLLMPVMNGYEVLNFLKDHETLRFIPVFVMTTESDPDSIEQGQRLGALGWLVKPFDEETLLEVVREYSR